MSQYIWAMLEPEKLCVYTFYFDVIHFVSAFFALFIELYTIIFVLLLNEAILDHHNCPKW